MSRRGHGEGTIYRRSDGRWTAGVSIGGRKRKYLYGKTRRIVQEKLTAALRAQHQGLLATGPSQRVGQYLGRWLADSVKASVRPRTYDSYALNVRRVIPHIGGLVLTKVGPADIQRCYGSLLEGGLSRRSVEQAHTVLHRAFRQAVLWNLMPRNPTEAVAVPRPERKEMITLTVHQVQTLFDSSVGDRYEALWVLLATTGLRLGEATGLAWGDVDLERGRIAVRQALQRQRGAGLVLVAPKTDRSRRTVHLAAGTTVSLTEHRKRQVAERLKSGPLWENHELVFCTEFGKPVDPARINEALHVALESAGLPRIRVHDLRHTAATILLSQNVHPKIVQELLGHSTITLTLDTYSHVTPPMHQEVAERMDKLFPATASNSS